jgi:hypothetical protein
VGTNSDKLSEGTAGIAANVMPSDVLHHYKLIHLEVGANPETWGRMFARLPGNVDRLFSQVESAEVADLRHYRCGCCGLDMILMTNGPYSTLLWHIAAFRQGDNGEWVEVGVTHYHYDMLFPGKEWRPPAWVAPIGPAWCDGLVVKVSAEERQKEMARYRQS